MQRWLNGSGHAEIQEENSKREKYVEKKVRSIEVSGNIGGGETKEDEKELSN